MNAALIGARKHTVWNEHERLTMVAGAVLNTFQMSLYANLTKPSVAGITVTP